MLPKYLLLIVVLVVSTSGCKTKSELRREQELEKIQSALQNTKADRADTESLIEEVRQEMSRLANVVEGEAQARRKDGEEARKELTTLSTRIQALEQRAVAEELAAKQPAMETPKASFESAKRLYDESRFEEASEMLRTVAKNGRGEEAKRAHFLLGESLFNSKEFASAALEFGEFRKNYPKDKEVPVAIFRQGMAFKQMGKKQEAKLFLQDLVDRYPKSPLSAKAKIEMRRLK